MTSLCCCLPHIPQSLSFHWFCFGLVLLSHLARASTGMSTLSPSTKPKAKACKSLAWQAKKLHLIVYIYIYSIYYYIERGDC